MTATEASRNFSDLLDAVEAGETVVVTRGGRRVAEISPAPRHTGRDLRRALAGIAPPDDDFAKDIRETIDFMRDDEVNPWGDD